MGAAMRPLISCTDRKIIGAVLRLGIHASWIITVAVARTVAEPAVRVARSVLSIGDLPTL